MDYMLLIFLAVAGGRIIIEFRLILPSCKSHLVFTTENTVQKLLPLYIK